MFKVKRKPQKRKQASRRGASKTPSSRVGSKRLFSLIFLVFFISGGVWTLHWLRRPSTLPIRHVALEATFQHLERANVEHIMAPFAQGGLLTFDMVGLREALHQLPWAAEVRIQRVWPDTISVSIDEQEAVAQWGDAALVNPQGQRFMPQPKTFPRDVVQLSGPEAQFFEVWALYHALSEVLAPLPLGVRRLSVDERGAAQLILSNHMQLLLGHEKIRERLQRFSRVYPQLIAKRAGRVVSVDLRYPHGMSIHWQ